MCLNGSQNKRTAQEHRNIFFFFPWCLRKKKKKRDLRARLAPILLKEVDLLPRLSSKKFFQILQSLLFYFVKSRDAIPWTLLVYADVENKKLSFVRCQLWKLGRKLLLGDFRNPWCICSSAQVILQDRGCIPLSWPYLTLLPLPSPSWQGSATFVPHVTDVLAAQKLAVNRESADSSLQWDVRDMEVERIKPEPSKCCICSASGAPWLTTQQAELSCRDFDDCMPTAGTRSAKGWRKDEGQWDNAVHFPGMSNPGSSLWLWQNHPGEWVLL